MNHSPHPKLAESEPLESPSAEAVSAVAPAEIGPHEQLLERHGLISHIVEVPETTGQTDVDRLLMDISRAATNTIRLTPYRFGVLLRYPTSGELSAVTHTLMPLATSQEAPHPHDRDPETQSDDRATHKVAAPRSGAVGLTEPGAAETHPDLVEAVSRVEGEIAGLSASLAPLTQGALAGQIVDLVDEMVTRRIEAEDRAYRETADLRRAWSDDVSSFWKGMEAVLRLLSETATQISDAETSLADASSRQGTGAGSEELQLGFDRIASSLERAQAASENGLAKIEAAFEVMAGDHAQSVSDLGAKIDAYQRDGHDRDAEKRRDRATELHQLTSTLEQLASDTLELKQNLAVAQKPDPELATLSQRVVALDALVRDLASHLTDHRDEADNEAPKETHEALDAVQVALASVQKVARDTHRLTGAMARDISQIMERPASLGPDALEPVFTQIEDLKQSQATHSENIRSFTEAAHQEIKDYAENNRLAIDTIGARVAKVDPTASTRSFEEISTRLSRLEGQNEATSARTDLLGQAVAEILALQIQVCRDQAK